jgi:hypothetical protein
MLTSTFGKVCRHPRQQLEKSVSGSATDGSEIKRWSTADVPASKRLDYFAAAVSEAVLPMGIDQADPDEFFAELRHASLGSIGVTHAKGTLIRRFAGRQSCQETAKQDSTC